MALDRGDQRLLWWRLAQPGKAAAFDRRLDALVSEGFQIHAGAEIAARAGEDADVQVVPRIELDHGRGQRLRDLQADGVAYVRPVDRHDLHMAFDTDQDGSFVQRTSLLAEPVVERNLPTMPLGKK